MGQQYEAIEDRLVNVIQRLQLQRETGQLTAKHGYGVAAEEGVVVFVNGKVTESRIGRRTGSEALNRLSSWEGCLCWFARAADDGANVRPFGSSSSSNLPTEVFPANPPSPSNASKGAFPSTPIPFSPTYARSSVENPRISDAHMGANPLVPQPVTQRQWSLNRIERLGLSRTHRRLFLLIDGQRSIPELIRLLGKGENDIYMLLQDLEHAAVIRIFH